MIEQSTTTQRRVRFEEIFDESYEAILAYARRRVGPEADDVVAETFAVAWRRLEDIPADALPWLYGVARRVISEQRRAGRRREALVKRLRMDVDTQQRTGEVSGREPVLQALARLGERDREALLLVAWEGLSAAQASRALGCSIVAFRVRLHRARKRLRAHLEQGSSGCPVPASGSVVAKGVKGT